MSETAASTVLSPTAYLEWETKQEERHEYENGKLIAMGGSSREHNLLVRNLTTLIWNHLRVSKEYELYPSELRVKSGTSDRYYYPDLVITKGKEKYLEKAPHTLVNPFILIEILSDSTEARDRGPKFEAYRSIDSMQEYLLVSQDKHQIEGFYKNDKSEWIIRQPVAGQDSTFSFISLDFELPLKDVYDRLSFS